MDAKKLVGCLSIQFYRYYGKRLNLCDGDNMDLKWNDDLLTGNAVIDTQHKELFNRIALFHEACKKGQGRAELFKAYMFLGNYVLEHFADEEAFQRQYSYPEYEIHKAHHEQFLKTFIEHKKKLEENGATISAVNDTIILMGKWIDDHINNMDKRLANFLKEKKKENYQNV